MSEAQVSTPRVQPRVWIGTVIWLAYVLLVLIMGKLSGIPYTHLGDSGGSLFFGVGISLVIGAALLAITASLLGWWRPALFDKKHSPR